MPVPMLGRALEPPETLRGSDGVERFLIDPTDPLVEPLTKGDRVLGWEGDRRYCLYCNRFAGRWELWRHEDDGVMRMSVAVPGFVDTIGLVPYLIAWLVGHDRQRGFDPALAAMAEQARADRAKAEAADRHAEEAADRLHHGLMKDIGHMEVGMSRRQWGHEPPAPAPPAPAPADPSPEE